ncbi:DUF4893 domain-containing protein [Sphingomonas bacterium]|uniref:DUF4893 domain-containing protein n=1 Tax=Sphingomonas bacterium TaxID=1895847 RepID=UPI001575431E|nr:DUF4893 domain-containing protein [Sphingomonas bacterium]
MRRYAVLLALALAGTVSAQASDWHKTITVRDRQRLRDWRTAWKGALAAVKTSGVAAVAADPVLFDPDAALIDRALPPAGAYRCRHVGIGTGLDRAELKIEPWGRCRIDGDDLPRQFSDLDGGERRAGLICADTDRRAIFLGTTMFGDEHRPETYGHAAGRDLAGAVERIGEQRWRLVLPYPRFGATLDLIELLPAS